MKNLILASFLALIFSQDLITTRAVTIPLSDFINIATEVNNDEANASYAGFTDFNFLNISKGYSNFMTVNNCNISSANDTYITFDIYSGGEGLSFQIGYGDETYWELHGTIFFDTAFDSFNENEFYISSQNVNLSILESCELEFWVTGNYGDETGLIDDLQDQINDLEAQIEGLLAELLDCEGCNGDINADENIDILDILAVVEHILDIDTDDCIE